MKLLGHREIVEQGFVFGAATGAARPGLCRFDQIAPFVGPRPGPEKN